jgi:hypothetical protein
MSENGKRLFPTISDHFHPYLYRVHIWVVGSSKGGMTANRSDGPECV